MIVGKDIDGTAPRTAARAPAPCQQPIRANAGRLTLHGSIAIVESARRAMSYINQLKDLVRTMDICRVIECDIKALFRARADDSRHRLEMGRYDAADSIRMELTQDTMPWSRFR